MKSMENYKFLCLYYNAKDSFKNPILDVRYAYYNIQAIFSKSKVEGFTQEQRSLFFNLIKEYNHYVNIRIREIKKRISHAEYPIYENFEESELGAYAGSYCMGYERTISCKEEAELKQELEFYECSLISFKGEVIPNDSTKRIPLNETIQKSRYFENILRNDSIHLKDIEMNIVQ